LEQLEQAIKLKRPRHIVVLVDSECEDRTARDAILQELAVTPDDLVILLNHSGDVVPDLPRLHSVMQM
jgi:hypothetical protein